MRKKAAIFIVGMFFVIMLAGFAYGSEASISEDNPKVIQLTLDQAVDQALLNSKGLKQADYNIERVEKVREQAADNVKYIPAGPTTDSASKAFTALVKTDLALQMSKKSKNAEEDVVVLKVVQAYTDILAAQEENAVAEAALHTAEWQLRTSRVSFQVGVLSLTSKIQAEAGYEIRKAALEVARQGLSDKYQSLNNLVGYKPEVRPVLIDRPEFSPININNLEAEIQRRIELSPSIWLAERQVELAKLDLELYDWTNPMREPYDAKKIDVDTAELQSADGKEQMRQGMRTIYNNIMKLEENYTLLQQNLKIAEENLRIAQLQYEVGTATKSQVLEAENNVAQAKKDIATVVYTHEVLKLRFDKPWAMAA